MANQGQLMLLKWVKGWNWWRGQCSAIKINLSGADLGRANLGSANLSRADLSRADLGRANLGSANLSRARLIAADLSRADLSGADLSRADLSGARLIAANLSGVNLSRAIFLVTNLSKANLSKANFSGTCVSGTFSGANFREANFREASLISADLSEADLSGADLSGADLSGADLSGADLSGADLSGAKLFGAKLIKANLSGADLRCADLDSTDLRCADLDSTDLSGADLSGADLSGANLSGASLVDTLLIASQLLVSNLTVANLTGACIQDWNINSATQLDDVTCEYIYLESRWSEQERKYFLSDRRPSDPNCTLAPGEFAKLYQKALSTVDLIFRNGVDWEALSLSLNKLRIQAEGAEFSVQAIENKNDGTFVVRVSTPPNIDKAEIEKYLKREYEIAEKALHDSYHKQLQLKDAEIDGYRRENTNLLGIVTLLGSRPINAIAMSESQSNSETFTNDLRGANVANFANQVQDNASQTVSNFTQNINSNIDDITKLITSLRASAQLLPEAQREEALVHLDDLQEDLSQPEKQKPNRLKTRLVALFAIASTASGVVVGATDFGNKVLDLSKKLGIELVHTPPNQQLPPSK